MIFPVVTAIGREKVTPKKLKTTKNSIEIVEVAGLLVIRNRVKQETVLINIPT